MRLTDAMLVYHGQQTGPGAVITMVLNPEFIEELEGLPKGWTNIDDGRACAALETRLYPRKRK